MRSALNAIGASDVDWVAAPAEHRERAIAALQRAHHALLADATSRALPPTPPLQQHLGWTVINAAQSGMRVRPWVEKLGERMGVATAGLPRNGARVRPVPALSVAQRNMRMVVVNLASDGAARDFIDQLCSRPAMQLGLTLALYCELIDGQTCPVWLGNFKPAQLLEAGLFMNGLGAQARWVEMLRQGIAKHV